MKKNFIILILSLCTMSMFAQKGEGVSVVDNADGIIIGGRSYKISIGAKTGANFSSMSGNPVGIEMDAKQGVGYHFGLVANIHFGQRTESSLGGTGLFGVQVETLYSQYLIKTSSDNLKLTCFEVPVLFQYYITPSLAIEVGPTFVASIGCSPDELSFDKGVITTKDLKNFDVKFSAGVGYHFKCGFTADARYNVGTSDLAGNLPCKVSAFQVSLGWMFAVVK